MSPTDWPINLYLQVPGRTLKHYESVATEPEKLVGQLVVAVGRVSLLPMIYGRLSLPYPTRASFNGIPASCADHVFIDFATYVAHFGPLPTSEE